MKRYFITGTDTEVGKTVATCQLLRAFANSGVRALGMKPVASGCEWRDGELCNSNVAAHHAASNVTAPLALVSPYRFLPPISPHLAAAQAGVSLDVAHLVDCAAQLQRQTDVLLIEGAGGWLAPLSAQQCMQDLALSLQAPVILVVGMRLGCLNHAQLSAQAIVQSGLPLAGWIANAVDPAMSCYAENLAYLQAKLPAPLLGEIPYSDDALHAALPEHSIAQLAC